MLDAVAGAGLYADGVAIGDADGLYVDGLLDEGAGAGLYVDGVVADTDTDTGREVFTGVVIVAVCPGSWRR